MPGEERYSGFCGIRRLGATDFFTLFRFDSIATQSLRGEGWGKGEKKFIFKNS